MSEAATIYLVDKDPDMRRTIEEFARSFHVLTEFHENAESLLQSYRPERSGCVVSEFRLMGMNGVAMQEKMLAHGYRSPIIFVTAFAETPLTVRAIQAGAITVLEKPFSRQDLWDALRQSLEVDQHARRIDAHHNQVRRRLSRITSKEREVLNLMVDGKANKEIASKLAVSVRTVEARRHQIFKKAGVESVAQLVKIVLEAGDIHTLEEAC
ncbi:MAG: response regulator transcription factor [Planctomycetaceae bacterium]